MWSQEKHSDGENDEKNQDPAQTAPAQSKPAEVEIKILRADYENLLARVKEFENLREQFLRSAADFDNARKRLAKERDEFVKFSQESLIRELLPVLDNFERALDHAGEENEKGLKSLAAGIQMVLKQLREILKNQGLRRVPTVGEMFDPHRHEAVGYVEADGEADEIVEEVEPGYFLHERLLRAAKVRVRIHGPGSAEKRSPSPDEKQEELT